MNVTSTVYSKQSEVNRHILDIDNTINILGENLPNWIDRISINESKSQIGSS
jgi:hypothetical protein